jgi:hypothetical protein
MTDGEKCDEEEMVMCIVWRRIALAALELKARKL